MSLVKICKITCISFPSHDHEKKEKEKRGYNRCLPANFQRGVIEDIIYH